MNQLGKRSRNAGRMNTDFCRKEAQKAQDSKKLEQKVTEETKRFYFSRSEIISVISVRFC